MRLEGSCMSIKPIQPELKTTRTLRAIFYPSILLSYRTFLVYV